jgi:DNA polymerase III delta prime subunit
MSVSNLLLWEKSRPKKLDDLILVPRIRKHFENGVNQSYIFYGHFGTGKTSLARILIGKYSKDKPFLEINSSMATSINVLRSEIEDFCKFTPMMSTDSDLKYVFLDEFERTSAEFQDAFKAFIEKYHRNVRFIITTNHINKISDGIKSRIPQINFDCENLEEEKYLKQEIFKKISNVILPEENKDIPKTELVNIVKKNFPDFRSTLVSVQNYLQTGMSDSSIVVSEANKNSLYELLFDKNRNYEEIYHYLMTNFGPEKIDVMISFLEKPFVEFIIKEKSNKVDSLFECNYIVTDYKDKLLNNTDPIILGMTIIGKLRDILIN